MLSRKRCRGTLQDYNKGEISLYIIIIIGYYAMQAAHRKHAHYIETIKRKNTKSTMTKILRLR